jgi:hypothetical protein
MMEEYDDQDNDLFQIRLEAELTRKTISAM